MDLKDILPIIISSTIAFFVGALLKKILSFPNYIKKKNYERLIAKYNRILSSDKFLAWQNELLKKYYGIEYFTNIFGEYYPVYIYTGTNYSYPFEPLCNETELEFKNNKDYKNIKYYKQYKNILQPKSLSIEEYHKIKRPNSPVFMLDKLLFNDESYLYHFTAWVGTYVENVYTSHILEYENYKLYCKYGKKNIELFNIFNKIKPKMSIRNKIHENKSVCEVLRSGCKRASMLGVQLIVMIKDYQDHQYKIVLIKRSDDVAERPGFFQFVPSGGFEIYSSNENCSKNDLKSNFSVVYAIFREYVEELFNEKDFEKWTSGETLQKIKNHERVIEVLNMIDKDEAHLEFLGSVVGLISLKNELSFVLRIDNEEYSKNTFKENHEGKEIFRWPISEIENRIEGIGGYISIKKILNPPSAALYSLLKNSHLYKEILYKE